MEPKKPRKIEWLDSDKDFETLFKEGKYDEISKTADKNKELLYTLYKNEKYRSLYSNVKFGSFLIKYLLRQFSDSARDMAIFNAGKLAGYIEFCERVHFEHCESTIKKKRFWEKPGVQVHLAKPKEYKKMNIKDMYESLDSNMLRAKELMLDTHVEISGKISSIDMLGYIGIVDIRDNRGVLADKVSCKMPSKASVLALNKDDIVTLRGTIVDVTESRYYIKVDSFNILDPY